MSPSRFRLGKRGRVVFGVAGVAAKATFSVEKRGGTIVHLGRVGTNSFAFAGVIGKKRLKPGRYRLIATIGTTRRSVIFRLLPRAARPRTAR